MWKYVIVGFQSDYYQYCFSKKANDVNYIFLNNSMGEGVLSNIQKLCCCEFINKYINIPLKEIWMTNYSNYGLDTNDNICFVFSKSQSWLLSYKNGMYIKKLRKWYPKCKIVIYLADVISSYYNFDVSFFKEKCDSILSYDKGDCLNYGLVHCELPYSSVEISNCSEIKESDVFFCGRAKDRLNDIYRNYDYFVKKGFVCNFWVTDVKRKYIERSRNINFNKKIKYSNYLKMLKKSHIILEINQKNSVGNTLRVKEALSYGKVLITNNKEIELKCERGQVFVCSDVGDIDLDELRNSMVKRFPKKDFDSFYMILEKLCDSHI